MRVGLATPVDIPDQCLDSTVALGDWPFLGPYLPATKRSTPWQTVKCCIDSPPGFGGSPVRVSEVGGAPGVQSKSLA